MDYIVFCEFSEKPSAEGMLNLKSNTMKNTEVTIITMEKYTIDNISLLKVARRCRPNSVNFSLNYEKQRCHHHDGCLLWSYKANNGSYAFYQNVNYEVAFLKYFL